MTVIYYKTERTSETGKKIQHLIDRAAKSVAEIEKFVAELNADPRYLMSDRYILGTGIVGLKFQEEPDMKVWKDFKGFPTYYSPRSSSKEGKLIKAKMDAFEKVEKSEIGDAVGIDDFFKRPGLSIGNSPVFFGIKIDADWKHKMPKDCIEVTATEYNSL